MFRTLFQPLAHFAFDHARVDAIATRRQHFFGNFRQQILVPALTPGGAARAFGQATAQDLQRSGERQAARRQILAGRRRAHQDTHDVMSQEQAVDLLNHAGWGLTPQHGTLALVGLEFVEGQFFFPAFVVQHDQALGRVPRLAHRRVILFFWPMRASSWTQISIVPLSIAFSRATASGQRHKFGDSGQAPPAAE